jgi:nucleoside-diphosphate-sugar epimerase
MSSPSQQIILITGASGFVAAHILTSFLEKGYNVRGTVRSPSSAQNVKESHAKYGDKLTFVIVPDITVEGAFDEAVKGVDGVIHTASPFTFNVEDPEKDLLIPAIKGTTGILESIQRCNPSVKRVVITSSFAAINDPSKGSRPGHIYTEADWNPTTYDEAKKGPPNFSYGASKKLAEKAAWDYVEKNKPNFTIATINPPMIYGPNEHKVESLDKLNTSSVQIYDLINGKSKEVPGNRVWGFADVRDVGQAHLRAYERPEAGGQRFLIATGNFSFQQMCDIIRKEFPELREKTPKGNEGAPLPDVYRYDASKAKKVLGMEFISLEQCVKDTVANLLELEKTLSK